MAGARNSLTLTESDAIAEAVSAESCHIVLETPPPDHVEKVSRYLESSVGYNRQNKVADEPAEAESDSGDSLFITQASTPEAERTRRRHRSLRSEPISPRVIEGSGSESDASSSDSHEVSKTDQERRKRRRKHKLPKFSFSFIPGRKGKPRSSLLPCQQNISLHNYTMGGFFKCVREQWFLSYKTGDDEKSLTADMDGKHTSPLSEEEEERSEDEDIKVVERKCFLAPTKAKSQQSWSSQLKREKETRKGGNARRETSQGRRHKRDLVEKLRSSEKRASGENTKICLPQGDKKVYLQQRAREEELHNDSHAAGREPHKPQRSPRLCPQEHRKASTTATEPQTDVLLDVSHMEDEHDSPDLFGSLPDLQSDTNNESEREVKKRKEKGGHHESIEEEEDAKGHSREEPEGLHAATSVDVEVEETPRLSEDNRAEPPASQTSDELEFNEGNCFENSLHDNSLVRPEEGNVPDSKQKKKKRKKSAAGNVNLETDGNLESDARVEDSGFSDSCNAENGGKKKTKKGKRSDEDEEQLQSRADAGLLSDDAEIKKKKKKRKKEEKIVVAEECEEEAESNRTLDLPPMSTEQLEELGNGLENTTAREETLESSCVKRKTPKKKKKPSSFDDAAQDRGEVVSVSFSNDAVTLEESADVSLKKKKKTFTEEVDISRAPEENEKVECEDDTQQTKEGLEDDAELATKKKKKKKKKKAKFEEVDISHTPEENEEVEDNTQILMEDFQDQDAEKKKKKKETKSEMSSRNISEENVTQSDDSVSVRKKEKKKKRTASFLAADAEENGIQRHGEQNRLDFATESAGNLEESVDGVREKKKKRKRKVSEEQDGVEKDHKQDVEGADETCQSALPECADTGVKRKKRKKKNKDEACSVIH